MRRAALLLFCCVPLLASEEVLLHSFKVAREDPFSPQGRARMDRAIASMGEEGGVQSAVAIADFLRTTYVEETDVRAERIETERRGRTAHNGIEQVERELKHLRARENAGATDVGPKITARQDKLVSMQEAIKLAKIETYRLLRIHEEIFRKRDASALASTRILSRLKPAEVATAVGALRKSLEVDQPDQVLALVRILRGSKRKETAGALVEIFSHPKTGPSGRTVAACAIAFLKDPESTRALIRRLNQKPATNAATDAQTGSGDSVDRARILHALGLAAQQRFKDFAAAAKWAETLK